MRLKKMMLVYILLSSITAFAQPDKLHFLTEYFVMATRAKSQQLLGPDDNEPFGHGYEWYDLNSATGAVTGANTYTAITDRRGDNVDQAIGVNSANYLYYLSLDEDYTNYAVYSANTTGGYQAATNRLVASVPDLSSFPTTMGVDRQDKAWFMTNTAEYDDDFNFTGYTVQAYSFQTNANGDASGLATNGRILPPAELLFAVVEDICFDMNDNMYLLVSNDDDVYSSETPTYYYICMLTAAQVADLAAGTDVAPQKRWQITRADGTPVYWNNYYGASPDEYVGESLMGGLALTAAGRLLVNSTESLGENRVEQQVWELTPSGENMAISTTSVTAAYTAQGFFEGSYASDLATNIFSAVLPVRFGAITGRLTGNRISLDWVSESETNNAYYEVQLSKNGTDFVTVGDKIASKAADGNADTSLTYNFTHTLAGGTGLAGLYGAAGLLLALFALSLRFQPGRKGANTVFFSIVMAMVVVAGISCQKSSKEEVETAADGKFYARILQVDKDGTKETSKIIVVRRED